MSNETIKRMPMSLMSTSFVSTNMHQTNDTAMPDLLWISKEQQQHPSTFAHPLRNTIRVNANGVRHKFDGKQWRTLCQSPDGYECRNLVFRSSLCQKHFYKLQRLKHSCPTNPSPVTPASHVSKRLMSGSNETLHHQHYHQHYKLPTPQFRNTDQEHNHFYKENDSTPMLEYNDPNTNITNSIRYKCDRKRDYQFFSIDSDQETDVVLDNSNKYKDEPTAKIKRTDAHNNNCAMLSKAEKARSNISTGKIIELSRLGIPLLTRTEEKSLANELIAQLAPDTSFVTGEHMARLRACQILIDNYSHKISQSDISSEWFYDFLLRNPRVPIHFQAWFSSAKSTLPSSDQLIDIKIWELGLIARSVLPSSSSLSSSSCSP